MTNKTITIRNPKALTADEFKSIQGSALHATMMKNRSNVSIAGSNMVKDKVFGTMVDWLAETCNSSYHIATTGSSMVKVYIEGDADLVNFLMAFNGQDLPEEDAVPAPPVLPSAPSSVAKQQKAAAQQVLDAVIQRRKQREKDDYYNANSWEDVLNLGKRKPISRIRYSVKDSSIEETMDTEWLKQLAMSTTLRDK